MIKVVTSKLTSPLEISNTYSERLTELRTGGVVSEGDPITSKSASIPNCCTSSAL